MSENTISLKPISELLEMNFFIPSYQRGYRWGKQQVEDLLNDISEFDKTKDGNFYCLQPLVIRKKEENTYEVIDGQQRITTITLIIHYFNEMWEGKQKIKEPQLSYETRDKSTGFLRGLEIEHDKVKVRTDKPKDNIDFYHISEAYQTIHDWVITRENFDKDHFKSKFQSNTKVIWYEITGSQNAIDTFIRINMGKIPLTNSELIKAQFLKKRNSEENSAELRQIEIANEWDRMEYALQNDDFWYFLNKEKNEKSARIEFLFDLMCENNILKLDGNYEKKVGTDEYKTFRYFSFYKETETSIFKLWDTVKSFFLMFEEWFEDRELYHKIGYLIEIGSGRIISEIIKQTSDKTKTEFISYLNAEIGKQIKCDKGKIGELVYGNGLVEKILLLHNIQTLLNNTNETTKFPFAKSKKDTWSIEHIHAQHSKKLSTKAEFDDWLKSIDQSDLLDELKNKIKELKDDSAEIAGLIDEITAFFGEPDINTIDNLALLWKKDNSALNNSIFPVKRNKIIELEKQGSFIPICTRNVFLKYYSAEKNQLSKWTASDRKAYLKDIENTISIYQK